MKSQVLFFPKMNKKFTNLNCCLLKEETMFSQVKWRDHIVFGADTMWLQVHNIKNLVRDFNQIHMI